MKSLPQATLIITFLAFCWLAMQAVHELGHVIGGIFTGADIHKVTLHPLTLSRTEFLTNPNPLLIAWSGSIIGAYLPLVIWYMAKSIQLPFLYLFRFFAAFCLIANGVYIVLGPRTGLLDTAIMTAHGANRWHFAFFGFLTVPLGLYLWHDQGKHFGFGESEGKVDDKATVVTMVLFLILIIVEILYF